MSFVLLASIPLKTFSQEAAKDFQLWLNLEVETPVNKNWMIHLKHQSRFRENASQYGYWYFDAGAVYKITKNLRFSANCILINKKKIDMTSSYRQQFEGYLTYRKKWGDFVLFDRLQTNMQFKNFNTDPQGNRLRDYYLRNKICLRYKHFKKLVPYVAEESYYKFDGKYYERGYNRTRVYFGMLYNLTDLWLAEACYTMEFRRDSKIPANNYFLSLGLVRTFFQ